MHILYVRLQTPIRDNFSLGEEVTKYNLTCNLFV